LRKKTPSSLDYEVLLRELAIERFRRAVTEEDFPRAAAVAQNLAGSSDRFWRWQGLLHLAGARLVMGESAAALLALEDARRTSPDAPPPLRAPAAEIAAHVLLETGRPKEALDVAGGSGAGSLALAYLRGLAAARLSLRELAEDAVSELARSRSRWAPALAGHVAAELDPLRAIDDLARGAHEAAEEDLAAPTPGILPTYALALSLAERGDDEEALHLFDRIAARGATALYWPIPYVRAFYHRATIHATRGETTSAQESARRFLGFWGAGDLDRGRVRDAGQLVKS
jgi:tetratricopeptide (TPR) repeat protein